LVLYKCDGTDLLSATNGCCSMSKKILNKRIRRGSNSASGFLPYRKGGLNMAIGCGSVALNQPNLFRVIDSSLTGYLVAALLCLSFFLQGFNYASADTVDDSSEIESSTEEVSSTEDFSSAAETVESSVISTEEDLNTETVPKSSEEEVNVYDTEDTATEESGDDYAESVDDVVEEMVVEDNIGSDDEQVVEDSVTENALLEEELTGSTESISVVQSDTAYTFNREECTLLATGSYYCLKPLEGVLDDALFAAPDEDGDLEIFLVREGVQSQVTSNQVDDAAPYFDKNSNTIVWHRLINDRYQIVSYDIDSGVESIITNTSENNMEPTRQGEYTVWQRWVNGSWNVMLHDGRREIKVTNGGGHNVAPYVHGSLVVWNRHNGDGQKTIEMYDIDSRSYVSVPDAEGLSVSNPRMVFVFDSLTPEGDVVTKGYDVLSRKFIDLASLPKELPDEIPHSDSTGETRALIQSKPTIKSELEELTESEPEIITPEPEIEDNTLDLSEFASTSESVLSTEFDLVIEPYNTEVNASSSEQIES
jgi:hypothetical protein